MITSDQIRAARALIRWSAEDLAARSGVGLSTIRRMETAEGIPSASGKNLAAVQKALEAAGVLFIQENGEGPGVRLRKNLTLDMFAGSGNAAPEFQRITARDDGLVIVTNPPYPSRKK
ncbi:helix-turn-helix transcriptional regulator [Nitrospirillum sp. BR 11163]|uniref:helix-turn-helix domain-containing protein n=1 Tax=Nitrospirillum sp. BR 11163 TaxID=3104323 RepID=UPI002AFF1C1D|nr:helix-turn-helix transcriptional regulator [Nitrospirillum sp. BR 11163]MEA1674102.1 helix-turn-helix transcriptional regulator [Nitrospirillum sp. BR 11163]